MKFLILGFLFSVSTFAADGHPRDSKCYEARREADNYCNSFEVDCKNMGACVTKRNSCPMNVQSKRGCEALNECMGDVESIKSKRPDDIAEIKFRKPCLYTWQSYGKCRLYNTGLEFITFPTCPGRRISGKNNDDVNFDCEGHRTELKRVKKLCFDLRAKYDQECSSKTGYKKINRYIESCKYESAKLFPSDTAVNGAKDVHDQERDKYKIIPPNDEGTGGSNGGPGTGK